MLIYLNDAIAAFDHALWQKTNVAESCRAIGNALQAMGRFEEAMEWHTLSINPEPDRATLFATLGNLFARQQRWVEAIAAYEQVIQLKPGSAEIYWSLANIYAALGQPSKEVDCRLQALKLNPDWATPNNQFELGNWLTLNHRLDEAIDCYRWALKLKPDWFEVQYNLAVIFALQGKLEAAIAHYQTAIDLRPDYAESYYGLGKALEQQERLEEAGDCYRQMVKFSPDSVNGLHALADVQLKQHQWTAATATCQQAINLQPDFAWVHHQLGYALLRQEQWEAAAVALQMAAKLHTNSPWTYFHLTEALIQQKRWQEAAVAGLQAVDLQPDLFSIYPKLGYALRQGWAEISPILVEEILPLLSPENHKTEFLTRLGAAFMQQQQFSSATLVYRLALSLHPTDARITAELERSIAAQTSLDRQIAGLRQQIEQAPNQPWFYSQLGNLLSAQNEFDEANALHQRACLLQGWSLSSARQYRFSSDWFTHNIPHWHTHLQSFAGMPHLQALEIGCFEGMSTCWLLDHILTHPTAKLTCIDLYFQDRFDLNIARTGAATKVSRRMGNSHNILPTLEPDSFNIIYVDGCHWADHVYKDATLSWQLLKPGGVMIFDDYEFSDPTAPGQDPKSAIDAFLSTVQAQIQVLHKAYQVVLIKLSS